MRERGRAMDAETQQTEALVQGLQYLLNGLMKCLATVPDGCDDAKSLAPLERHLLDRLRAIDEQRTPPRFSRRPRRASESSERPPDD